MYILKPPSLPTVDWLVDSRNMFFCPAFLELMALETGANDHTVYHFRGPHPRITSHDAQKIQRLACSELVNCN